MTYIYYVKILSEASDCGLSHHILVENLFVSDVDILFCNGLQDLLCDIVQIHQGLSISLKIYTGTALIRAYTLYMYTEDGLKVRV